MDAPSNAPNGATHELVNKERDRKHIPTGMYYNQRNGCMYFSRSRGWHDFSVEKAWVESRGYYLKPVSVELENK